MGEVAIVILCIWGSLVVLGITVVAYIDRGQERIKHMVDDLATKLEQAKGE